MLEIVAEQTGYPTDLLDMELDLEADLGIDTVKQAEVFASIRESYGIERDDALKLRDYPTLNHVVGFVRDRAPGATAAVAAPAAPAPAVAAVPEPVAVAAPEPPPVAAAAPPPVAAAAPAPSGDGVEARVLEVVAEQTGYPTDLLDMDLDLEADLGIDTVKQAEVFASIRESYGIERDDALKLRDYPTLNHVVGFVRDRAPNLAASPVAPRRRCVTGRAAPAAPVAPAPACGSAPAPAASDGSIEARVLEIVAEQTGYPTDLLDMELDLEADLGIDTVKQAEVFASIRESYGIERDDALKLRDYPTLNHVVGFVRDRAPGATAAVAAPVAPAPAPAVEAPSAPETEPAPTASAAPQAASADDGISDRVLEIVAEQTGYPTDLLDMELDLEADLGIDTVKQAEVFAGSGRATGSSAMTR